MERLFVPFSGNEPVAVCIKGHRLVFLTHDRHAFDISAKYDQWDTIRPLDDTSFQPSDELELGELSSQIDGRSGGGACRRLS